MFDLLQQADISALIWARNLLGNEYVFWIRIAWESIVVWGGSLLIFLWFRGIFQKHTEHKHHALEIFFTIILTFIIYSIINFGIPPWRPNPQEVAGGIQALIPHPIDNSFPSGHALFTAALMIWICQSYRVRSIIIITALIGFITASARVIGGVHYPGDILGGWILGGIGSFLMYTYIIQKSFFQTKIIPGLIRFAQFFKL